MHISCEIKKPEGLYRVRLYDSFVRNMEGHASILFDANGNSLATVVSGDLVFDDGFGDNQSSFEDELFQGKIEHQNFKLSLEADAVFGELVETIRTLDTDIWLEVTFEQRAKNIPEQEEPFVMVQPRKERLYWWGRLVRGEASGYTNYQAYKQNIGLLRDPLRKVHVGGLELTFVHWLHDRLSNPASDFLDYFRGLTFPFPSTFCTVFKLLDELIRSRLSPTKLVAISDGNEMKEYHLWSATEGLQIPYSFTSTVGTTNLLNFLRLKVKDDIDGTYKELFFKKGDIHNQEAGEGSLYTKWPTLGDAIATFCREFFMKMDVELPTLKKAWDVADDSFGYDNSKANIEKYWMSASRWMFCGIDDFELPLVLNPDTDSIKYSPAAQWIKTIEINQPNSKELNEYPVKYLNCPDGKDIKYITLFRLSGSPSPRGAELYAAVPLGAHNVATSVTYDRGDVSTTYSDWSQFHTYRNLDLWGGIRAVVELDHNGAGIAPFPAGIKSYGEQDFGDFRNLRYFDASPGLLYTGSKFGRFSVIEISHKPGSMVHHIRGIERRVLDPQTVTIAPPIIDTPEDPTVDPPNEITTHEELCGLKWRLTFSIATNDRCIDHIELWKDSDPPTIYPGVNPDEGGSDSIGISYPPIDFCQETEGPHTFHMKIFCCDGKVIEKLWPFTVNHLCC